jgi:DNA polymerase
MVSDSNKGAGAFLPTEIDLPSLRTASGHCQGCDLFRDATQTVFGAGAPAARLMFVGEQPGDQEDRLGAPFVGPAGRLLDRALEDLGIDRETVYMTNAVKHFKFEMRGKRRIHQKPTAAEIDACRPWLDAEMLLIDPEITVVLGATAARALLGPAFRVTEHRGELLPRKDGAFYLPTVHPSAVLRAPDRETAYKGFLADLGVLSDPPRSADGGAAR